MMSSRNMCMFTTVGVIIILTMMQLLYIPSVPIPKWETQFFVVQPTNNNNNSSSSIKEPLLPPPQPVSSTSVAAAAAIMPTDIDMNENPVDNSSSPSTSTTNDDNAWWKSTIKSADTLLKDIDQQRKNETKCGWWKCYYPSLAHPDFGYIIGQRRDVTMKSNFFAVHNLQKSYNLALKLEKEYNLHHFMVCQPTPINATKQLAQVLNEGVLSYYGKDYKYLHLFRETLPAKYKRDKIIVQVVKTAPQPHLLIPLKQVILHGTVLNLPHAQDFFFGNQSVPFSEDFCTNLIRDWNATRLALDSEPDLFRDFQFMLDKSGHIWQMDLDRVYGNEERTVRSIDRIQKTVIDPILNLMKKEA